MSEKLAQLEKKGGSSGSGTLKEYCYHLVYDNPHTDFTSADVFQNRVTINEGAYAVVDGKCYVYVDFTTKQSIATMLGIIYAPSATIVDRALATNKYYIGTRVASGGTNRFIEAEGTNANIPSNTRIIAYGELY